MPYLNNDFIHCRTLIVLYNILRTPNFITLKSNFELSLFTQISCLLNLILLAWPQHWDTVSCSLSPCWGHTCHYLSGW